MPRSWATPSPRCSRRSASPTAMPCGCSGRRPGSTGGAAGRPWRRPRFAGRNAWKLVRRLFFGLAANRFIFRRGRLRGMAHWLIMWGCLLAAAITFPLVWGWIHFTTVPGDLDRYRTMVFGFPVQDFHVESVFAFVIFHGLVWSSFLVIAGVMIAVRRRLLDHGAASLQQFGEDFLPLILLFAISVTGLLLTASYTWMRGLCLRLPRHCPRGNGHLHAAVSAVRQVVPRISSGRRNSVSVSTRMPVPVASRRSAGGAIARTRRWRWCET